jgi:hypothetical protein
MGRYWREWLQERFGDRAPTNSVSRNICLSTRLAIMFVSGVAALPENFYPHGAIQQIVGRERSQRASHP